MLLVKSPCIWHHCSISCSKDKLEELLIPRLELDGGRKPHIVRYTMTKKLKPYTQCRHSMFERVQPISERLALHMLEVGYKQPSRFGRWCPVKVYCFCFCHILNLSLFFFMETKLAKLESLMFPNKSTRFRRRKWHICIYIQLEEGDCIQPMEGPGYPTYPAIYRQHIYFLSSSQAREQFMADPMLYLRQPSPKPVVPIRMAVLGAPKSGKTTCKCNFEYCIAYRWCSNYPLVVQTCMSPGPLMHCGKISNMNLSVLLYA